jgi:hypothetical protein
MAARKKAPKSPQPFKPSFEEKEIGAMGMADDMRRLTEEILSAFDARVGRVATLRQEMIEKLNGFRQAMKNLQRELRQKAADLKRFLGDAAASRMKDFRAMHQSIRAGQEARNGQVGGMLSGFRREREAAASHWQNMAATRERKRAGKH